MQKQVLFIQGAGEGAYELDGVLSAYLQDALGPEYDVLYPEMPNEGEPDYGTWKVQIEEFLSRLNGEVILVGHSVGGSVLLKYLTHEKVTNHITGVLLIAPPYDESVLPEASSLKFDQLPRMFFYHSRDDEIVPFSHLTFFAEKLPKAAIRKFDGRGHQFCNDLSEVVMDIKGL
ncbi:RBBP9/YdeN family alpha/beta hydrolase [Thalassobacillus devorans]|uniref:RBBP9/YdeN family alpha/beta hydrolase n=1 Tax=Thalassobacillus devorans TaxID=279813 RepID=UPI0004901C25|nr:alpha/beta fold hydrolase [Thalassobacillus devorans]